MEADSQEIQCIVKLVPFETKHADRTLEWVNDPELMILMNRVKPVTHTEHLDWYENIVRQSHIFAIIAGEHHIGNCCLKDVNTDGRSRKAEIWVYIGDKESRGKGYGKQTVEKLLDYAFRSLNLNRVYLYLMAYNQAAHYLYLKIGFKEEGRFREDVFINGEYHDTIHMAILKSEWT